MLCIYPMFHRAILLHKSSNLAKSRVQVHPQGRVGYFRNERAYSVESKLQGISSNSLLWKRNEIVAIQTWSLTRQTCGQRSGPGMAAGGKRRAISFYLFVRICYMFLMLKCRGEPDLGLCLNMALAKRMPLRSANFRRILRPNTLKNRKSALRSGTSF